MNKLKRFLNVTTLLLSLCTLWATNVARADANCPIRMPQSQLCASISWIVPPSASDEGAMSLKFWSAGGSPQGPYVDLPDTLSVVLWMADMGHGSSPTRIRRMALGVYEVSRMYFVMNGDWQLKIQRKRGATVVDEAIQMIHIGEFLDAGVAQSAVEQGEGILLDVRDNVTLGSSVAQSARWIRFPETATELPALIDRMAACLPAGKKIFVYCYVGVRARYFETELRRRGRLAYDIGGYQAWADAGRPTEVLNRPAANEVCQ